MLYYMIKKIFFVDKENNKNINLQNTQNVQKKKSFL